MNMDLVALPGDKSNSNSNSNNDDNDNDNMARQNNKISPLETDDLGITTLLLKHNKEIKELNDALRNQQNSHQLRLRELEEQIRRLSEEKSQHDLRITVPSVSSTNPPLAEQMLDPVSQLTPQHIERYSRQLLLQDGFGVEGQCKLLSSSVLVVGAGGIGSTVLLYLAASGIGHISIVDFDEVDMSNLHRQIIHTDANVGINKAISACRAVQALNPTIECAAIQVALTHENALDIISRHDVIVDASDNPRTRYLINDACVLSGKPLVSGSAIGTEGQLTVYNHLGGPCYRCLYPKPNAAEGCKSCSDSGVLGPVPGLIGILQSLEVLKVLTGVGATMHDRMLMYDSLNCSFMNIKKPPKSQKCPICSDVATITSMQDSLKVSQMTRGPTGTPDKVGQAPPLAQPTSLPSSIAMEQHISCQDYFTIRNLGTPHILLDVRVPRQYEMCRLEGAINIPLGTLQDAWKDIEALGSDKPIYCICRRGILSVEATRTLSEASKMCGLKIHSVKNIVGGLTAWAHEVDPSFPKY